MGTPAISRDRNEAGWADSRIADVIRRTGPAVELAPKLGLVARCCSPIGVNGQKNAAVGQIRSADDVLDGFTAEVGKLVSSFSFFLCHPKP
jgi:hypothetical protein